MAKAGEGETLANHLLVLERERIATDSARQDAESIRKELRSQKDDTIAKLRSSETYISRLESRSVTIFDTLKKAENANTFQLVGESLDELRLIRTKIKSEQDLLAEKGLRRGPVDYSFFEGETVVIIAEGEFNGFNAIVKVDDASGAESLSSTVTVLPALDLFEPDERESLIELRRSDVAI